MTTAHQEPPAIPLLDEAQRLRGQLRALRGRLRSQMVLELARDAALLLVATAALLVLLDWWYRPGVTTRALLLGASLVAVVAVLGVRALRLARSAQLDDLSLALAVDRLRPGTGQRIADVLQLPELLETPGASDSPALVRLAVRRACEALAQADWRSLWNRRRTALAVGGLLLAAVIPTTFAMLAPDAARLSLYRWLRGSNERWPQATYLAVTGLDEQGRLLVPRDEAVTLEVRSDLPNLESRNGRWWLGGRGEPTPLRSKPATPRAPASVVVRERAADGSRANGVMTSSGPSRFRFEFSPSSASSTFTLTGGDDWLGPIRLDRVDRPSLAKVGLRVREPGTADPSFRTIPDPRATLAFLPDTEVELTLTGDQPIRSARMVVHPEPTPALTRVDDRTFIAHWTLTAATTLEIGLTSADTGLDSRPTFLSLGLMRDREPRITLRASGVGGHITSVATIPLTLAATDDLGLASLRIQVERTTPAEEKTPSKTTRQTVALPLAGEGGRAPLDQQVRHDVILQADPPAVGTSLRIVGEAEDRATRGAQLGRSAALQFQVVPPEDLFYELLIRQRAERAKFLAVVESAQKQTPTLAGAPSADDFLKLVRTHQANMRQLDQIASRIADTLQEMKLNQIGSPKSHRLLQEGVIDPTRALNAGPMTELRGVFQSLGGASEAKPGADREGARRLHGEVVAKLQAILEQMSQWESFVDVVNQVAEVIKMQRKVLQDTEHARESRTEEVFDAKP